MGSSRLRTVGGALDGRFAGWGGFQREANGADFALVLAPAYWGYGAEVTRAALDRGFGELGLEAVLIALPRSRTPSASCAGSASCPAARCATGPSGSTG